MSGSPRSARTRLRGDARELFTRHFQPLVSLTQRDAGVSAAVAEDCADFAFLQLCRHQPGRDRIGAWLRVVARPESVWLAPRPQAAAPGRRPWRYPARRRRR
jgi:hypothetical protein